MDQDEDKIARLIEIQNEVVLSTVSDPHLIKLPLSLSYVRLFLKELIKIFEEAFEAEYIIDEIYLLYVEYMNKKIGRIENTLYFEHENKNDLLKPLCEYFDSDENIGFVIYLFDNFKLPIIEINSIVKFNTTGLRTWPAAVHLLDYLKNNKNSDNKNEIKWNRENWNKIVELGSGTGLLGLGLIQSGFFSTGHYIFTDSSQEALKQIELSLFVNQIMTNDKMKVFIQKLNWQDHAFFDFSTSVSDLIIASDVIFDTTIIEPFILTLKNMFKVYREADSLKRYPDCLICCCIRNNITINNFKEQLEKFGFVSESIHQLSTPKWIEEFNNYVQCLSNSIVIEDNFNQLLSSNTDNTESVIFRINVKN